MSGQPCQLESEKAIKWFLVLILACLRDYMHDHYMVHHYMIVGAYIIFYQGEPIDHGTNVPGPVAQSSAESE